MSGPGLDAAIAAVDTVDATDPNEIEVAGRLRPEEPAHAERMTGWSRPMEQRGRAATGRLTERRSRYHYCGDCSHWRTHERFRRHTPTAPGRAATSSAAPARGRCASTPSTGGAATPTHG